MWDLSEIWYHPYLGTWITTTMSTNPTLASSCPCCHRFHALCCSMSFLTTKLPAEQITTVHSFPAVSKVCPWVEEQLPLSLSTSLATTSMGYPILCDPPLLPAQQGEGEGNCSVSNRGFTRFSKHLHAVFRTTDSQCQPPQRKGTAQLSARASFCSQFWEIMRHFLTEFSNGENSLLTVQ